MADLNRVVIRPEGDIDRVANAEPGSFLRAFTWLVLVTSVVGNTVSSFAGGSTAIHLGFGGLTAICVLALLAQNLRRQ